MRAITAVTDGPNENVACVEVRILNAPGRVVERWTVRRKPHTRTFHPAHYEVTLEEDGNGAKPAWKAEADTLASAFDVCLVGRTED